jgi:hypothetical protein
MEKTIKKGETVYGLIGSNSNSYESIKGQVQQHFIRKHLKEQNQKRINLIHFDFSTNRNSILVE